MFWDGVSFYFNDLTAHESFGSAGTDTCLQLFDASLIDFHRASTDGYVVVFGEHPSVEIGRYVIADVHFG